MAQITHGATRRAEIASGATIVASTDSPLPQLMNQFALLVRALAAIGTCTVAAALVAILVPGLRPVLLQEDGIIEMASVACLVAVVLGSGAAIAMWGLRAPLLVAGLIGLAELMDETSFGSRVFGFQPPALYGGGELDGFHDLLILAYRLLGDISVNLAWTWVGLMLIASVGVTLFALRLAGNGVKGVGSWFTDHVLVFLHIGFVGLAQVIDVATTSNALSAVEEMFEFNAALVLVFYVGQQVYNSWSRTAARLSRGPPLR
jgi:hypothetical protein